MTRSLKAHALKINLSKAFLSLSPNSYIFNPSAFYKKPGRLFQCTFFSGNFNAQKIQNGILYIIFSYRIYQDWQQLRIKCNEIENNLLQFSQFRKGFGAETTSLLSRIDPCGPQKFVADYNKKQRVLQKILILSPTFFETCSIRSFPR